MLIRLSERAFADELERGARRSTADAVWIVARGRLAAGGAAIGPGRAVGMIRIVRPETPVVELVAAEPSALVGLAHDDVRDVLEEEPAALAAIADRLAELLLDHTP